MLFVTFYVSLEILPLVFLLRVFISSNVKRMKFSYNTKILKENKFLKGKLLIVCNSETEQKKK